MAAGPGFGPVNRLVVGLDYGTTFTGVAFQAVTTRQGGGIATNLNLITSWPGAAANNEKVPSEISYSPSTDGARQWGADFSPSSLKLVWTKLDLEQRSTSDQLSMILEGLHGTKNLDFKYIQESFGLPEYPAKDAVQIVTDYLTYVREKLWEELLQVFGQAILAAITIDLVVTVPAMWSEAAKNRTFRAVWKAGFNKYHFPGLRDTILVSEAEATGISLLKSLRPQFGQNPMLPNDSFVVCDAGGGTVDLISYEVKQYQPILKIEQITPATGGDKCGATFIERAFRKWLEWKLGQANFQLLTERQAYDGIGSHSIVEPKMVSIMEAFTTIKHAFAGIGNPERDYIDLPYPLNNLNDPANGIRNGVLCITDRDLQRMFQFSVNRTVEMILSQIGLVQHAGSRATYVFLFGGFAESEYLFRTVEQATQMRGTRLLRPEHSWSAVVRGAVAKGVERDESKLVRVHHCRRHYGVSVSQPFSEWKHSPTDAYIDPFDGQRKAKDQIVWLFNKGDAIFSTEPKAASLELRRRFGPKDPKYFRTYLVACDDDTAPQRLSEINSGQRAIAVLNYDFENTASEQIQKATGVERGKTYNLVDFKIEIILDQEIEFKVSCNGNAVQSTIVPYN